MSQSTHDYLRRLAAEKFVQRLIRQQPLLGDPQYQVKLDTVELLKLARRAVNYGFDAAHDPLALLNDDEWNAQVSTLSDRLDLAFKKLAKAIDEFFKNI